MLPHKNQTIPNGKMSLFSISWRFFVSTTAPIDIFQNENAPFPPHALILEICDTWNIIKTIVKTVCYELKILFKNNGYRFLPNYIKNEEIWMSFKTRAILTLKKHHKRRQPAYTPGIFCKLSKNVFFIDNVF